MRLRLTAEVDLERHDGAASVVGVGGVGGVGSVPSVTGDLDEVVGGEAGVEESADAVDGELVGDGGLVEVALDAASAKHAAGQ